MDAQVEALGQADREAGDQLDLVQSLLIHRQGATQGQQLQGPTPEGHQGVGLRHPRVVDAEGRRRQPTDEVAGVQRDGRAVVDGDHRVCARRHVILRVRGSGSARIAASSRSGVARYGIAKGAAPWPSRKVVTWPEGPHVAIVATPLWAGRAREVLAR